MITSSEFNDCLAYLVAAFPEYELTEQTIKVYYAEISDLDCSKADLLSAFRKHIKTSVFFPKVAEIRNLIAPVQTYTPPPFVKEEFINSQAIPVSDRIAQIRQALTYYKLPTED